MLVLSRKRGEKIVVPQCGITVTVLQIGRQRVKVGISAPDGVTVHRAEVWLRRESGDKRRAQRPCKASGGGSAMIAPDPADTVAATWNEVETMQLGLEPASGFREQVKRCAESAGTGVSIPPQPRPVTEPQAQDRTRRIRVLIADPDEYLAGHYDEFLGKQGFEVDTAADGLNCLEKLRTFVPDVLVLEPAMPWGGGDGVLALMHEEVDRPLPSVVILTRGCSPAVLYSIAPYEIADFQVKPLPARRLAERIRRIVTSRDVCQTACQRGE